MEKSVRIFQLNKERFNTEETIATKVQQNDLCFYRFIGGNASDTEEMINELSEIKAKNVLLIGLFRFPFRFEGKKRSQTADTQYFRMKELCDAIIYFHSDSLMETIDSRTPMHEAHLTFNKIEEQTINNLKEMIEMTGEMNIDFQDIETFIQANRGPLFLHTIESESFDEPLKYLIEKPYLPADFTDGKQLIINIGYTQDIDMDAFRQINLRLHDLFSKADLFKLGSYFIDEPGHRFKITLLVNGMDDPTNLPADYKNLPKYKGFLKKVKDLAEKGREKAQILKG